MVYIPRVPIITPSELTQGRERAGLTRTELAAKIGVAERTVYRWEAGERRIGVLADSAIRQALSEPNPKDQDGSKTRRSRTSTAARKSNSHQ